MRRAWITPKTSDVSAAIMPHTHASQMAANFFVEFSKLSSRRRFLDVFSTTTLRNQLTSYYGVLHHSAGPDFSDIDSIHQNEKVTDRGSCRGRGQHHEITVWTRPAEALVPSRSWSPTAACITPLMAASTGCATSRRRAVTARNWCCISRHEPAADHADWRGALAQPGSWGWTQDVLDCRAGTNIEFVLRPTTGIRFWILTPGCRMIPGARGFDST